MGGSLLNLLILSGAPEVSVVLEGASLGAEVLGIGALPALAASNEELARLISPVGFTRVRFLGVSLVVAFLLEPVDGATFLVGGGMMARGASMMNLPSSLTRELSGMLVMGAMSRLWGLLGAL
jgi:hypothetical protein